MSVCRSTHHIYDFFVDVGGGTLFIISFKGVEPLLQFDKCSLDSLGIQNELLNFVETFDDLHDDAMVDLKVLNLNTDRLFR